MSRRLHRRGRLLVAALAVLAIFAGFVVIVILSGDPAKDRRERTRAAGRAIADGRFDEARLILGRLVTEEPHNARLSRDYAISLLETGRFDAAAEACRAALRLEPDFAPLHVVLSEAARRVGDRDTALREARAATKGYSVPDGAWTALASLLLDAGRMREGVAALTRAVERRERGSAAAVRLGSLAGRLDLSPAVRSNMRRGLEAALGQAREAHSRGSGEESLLTAYVNLALICGETEEALVAVRAAMENRPDSTVLRVLFARVLIIGGATERAARVLDDVEGDIEPRLAAEIARANLGLGRNDAAVRVLDRALGEAPKDVTLLRLKLHAEGAEATEKTAAAVLAERPHDEVALAARAGCRLRSGRIGEALADSSRLVTVSPDSPAAAWLHGLALLAGGDSRSALMLLRRGRSAAPSEEDASRWLVRAALGAGDRDVSARESATLSEERDPALLAGVAALEGDLDAAVRLAGSEGFAGGDRSDRILASTLLAARGCPGPARRISEELRSGAGSPGESVLLGDLLRAMGDEAGARRAFERAAASEDPAAITALLRLAPAKDLDPAEAVPVLAGLVVRLKEHPAGAAHARLLEARIASLEADPADQEAAAREVLVLLPTNQEALELLLAAQLERDPESADAEEVADRLLAVAPGNRLARSTKAAHLLARATKLMSAGFLGEAVDPMSDLVELTPVSPVTRIQLGTLRLKLGETESAERLAGDLLALEGGAYSGNMLLGAIWYSEARIDNAVEAFREALAARPEARGALAALGTALLASGKPAEALDVADRLLGKDPGCESGLRLRVSALCALGRAAEAVEQLEESLARDPAEVALQMILGRLLLESGKHEEALVVFEEVVRRWTTIRGAHIYRVAALLGLGRREEARRAAEQAMKIESLEVTGLLLRSTVHAAAGNADAELADLEAAVAAEPTDGDARRMLGERLLSDGHEGDARRHLERAVAGSDTDVRARLLLALIAERDGRNLEARDWYENILAIDPSEPVAANNLACHILGSVRAVELARRATSRAPGEGEFAETMAQALSRMHRHEEASAEAERATRLAPTSYAIALSAARIHLLAGDREKARTAAMSARTLAAKEEIAEVKAFLERLDRLPAD